MTFEARGQDLTLGFLEVTGTIRVPTPINPDDAASKAYVDGLLAGLSFPTQPELKATTTTLVIEEADGSPRIPDVTRIILDQADGFVLTNPSAKTARIDFTAVSGWTDDGTIVRLTTVGDTVGIGTASTLGTAKVAIVGSLGFASADGVAPDTFLSRSAAARLRIQDEVMVPLALGGTAAASTLALRSTTATTGSSDRLTLEVSGSGEALRAFRAPTSNTITVSTGGATWAGGSVGADGTILIPINAELRARNNAGTSTFRLVGTDTNDTVFVGGSGILVDLSTAVRADLPPGTTYLDGAASGYFVATGTGGLLRLDVQAQFSANPGGALTAKFGTLAVLSDAITIADNLSGGVPATASISPTNSMVLVTNNDPDGANVTITETFPTSGQFMYLVNVGANTITILNLANQVLLSGGANVTLGQYDTLTLIYASDRWVQLAQSNN